MRHSIVECIRTKYFCRVNKKITICYCSNVSLLEIIHKSDLNSKNKEALLISQFQCWAIWASFSTEPAVHRCSIKQVLLNFFQNLQKKHLCWNLSLIAGLKATLLKTDSGKAFSRTTVNFSEWVFYRAPLGDYFCQNNSESVLNIVLTCWYS